jgi:hypothetical protein
MAPDDFSVKVLTTGYWPSYTQVREREGGGNREAPGELQDPWLG